MDLLAITDYQTLLVRLKEMYDTAKLSIEREALKERMQDIALKIRTLKSA